MIVKGENNDFFVWSYSYEDTDPDCKALSDWWTIGPLSNAVQKDAFEFIHIHIFNYIEAGGSE